LIFLAIILIILAHRDSNLGEKYFQRRKE